MGFSIQGTIIAASLLLPSLLVFLLPPQNAPEKKKTNLLFLILEHVGRVACVAILVLSKDAFNQVNINIWFWLMSLSTVAYYGLWMRYILKDSRFDLLIEPLWILPVPMAVFPCLAFAFAGVWSNSLWLFSAACVLAVGHIIHWLDISAQAKKEKSQKQKEPNKNVEQKATPEKFAQEPDSSAKLLPEDRVLDEALAAVPEKSIRERRRKERRQRNKKEMPPVLSEEQQALKIAEELEQGEHKEKAKAEDIDELLKDVLDED